MTASVFYSFFMFLSLSITCYGQEIFDVETLPSLRTKQYSVKPYKKIIVFSAPRTGSSLVYNIFRFLFENESNFFSYHNSFSEDRLVLKTHKFSDLEHIKEENVFYIFTIRDPIKAIISNYRICPRQIIDNRAFAEQLINRHKNYLLHFEKMYAEGQQVIWLRFEDFVDNLEYLFQYIESHFFLTIAPEDKELMKKGYSKENVQLCIQNFIGFNEYLPISGFHGKHISLEKYIPPEEFMSWLNFYLERVKELFKNYGYFIEKPLVSNPA